MGRPLAARRRVEQHRMPADDKQWDFFLAHAGADAAAAEELFEHLRPHAEVFLDSRCLLPGDDWDRELSAAQARSRVTVVLVSSRTDDAYYQREEIAAALDMSRRDEGAHRVVPVYLDDSEAPGAALPYGLRLKHGISAAPPGSMASAAQELLELLDRLRGAPVSRARRESSARAIVRITEGSARERLAGLSEVTEVFRPLLISLVAILGVCVLLLAACVLTPGLETRIDRTLAVAVLGTLCAGLLMSLMFLFVHSLGLAREIIRSGPPG